MVPVPDRVDCLLCKKMRGGFFKTTNKCKTVKKRELISGCPEITLKSFPLPWQVTVGGDVLNRSTLDQNCAQARLSTQLRIVSFPQSMNTDIGEDYFEDSRVVRIALRHANQQSFYDDVES